ncbi:MAG TPA: GTPase Era [Candidatus Woesebacteria bacterium]|nr:GTPase Era [Candidatus Shapirobacteria bacterium]HOR02295.1 GTPase Era [Candidatus Woesebacteria bacterium]
MTDKNKKQIKMGKVVLIGRPNTGKSSLLNAMMAQKVAITSPLPQTTRKNSRVIYSDQRGKIIFSDTPGIMAKIDDLIGRRINKEAPKELNQADVILCVVDISRPKNEEENKVIGLLRKVKVKKILVYNKIDVAKGSKDHLAEYNYLEDEFDRTIEVSATKEKNIKGLINLIFELLPDKIDQETKYNIELAEEKNKPKIGLNSKEYIAEIIREKAYLFLRKEVPYSINVEVDSVIDKRKLILIKATILTTAERYKKMIIGRGGKKIREIGYNARKELELMSERKIYLELKVEVDKHWPEREINR